MRELTVWQYRLLTPEGSWLADVILRSDGYFSTVSDYGNYAFRWTAPGMPFRDFVVRIGGRDDRSYVCSKLGTSDWWDGAATLKGIREHIIEYRRRWGWTKERAAEEWEKLGLALGYYDGRDARHEVEMEEYQFHDWLRETRIDDASEFASLDYEPQLRAFCREVMPALAAAIRAQLQAESAEQAAPEVSR
ncbi:hypothetical protein FJV41_19840 [Myxococcus llanfairpwllgwyngyllgogerychwyrndrobwllllantysiliogogogochensis]|uniref:Uncharacterized protein n=1 Tax=Myxococcus llanfairpwllgwyngyllgogerychwyrndrobwllllantysiliogogogochensis TaxID=2590453 RepID=A0A540WZ31_9BACT|nr:hypothetical protein [Myxococcus llanfairpwllgwyngyllgogerychwyrndrobwllllantysiliogogogochensis]TQF14223.1 hypothetical protein FJV41_19840 [Myxococcus llanfairpwllgwyngyllgogerychwyrndrobwllllantysiliogogogochensis]